MSIAEPRLRSGTPAVTPAPSRLDRTLATIEPVSLEEVLAVASLQTRVDRKYLVSISLFESLLAELSGQLRVLEIEGLCSSRYRSIYFDTAELDFFHQHLQGRRLRYKVRTREYLDTGQCMLEVKSKGRRAETVKQRRPHPLAESERLNQSAREFVASRIGSGELAAQLHASLETNYRRVTLVHERSNSRITCDVDLVCTANGAKRYGRADEVLIETKCEGGPGIVDRWLRAQRIRPHSVSKYCIGIALLYPHVRSNPWRRTLRRHFAWDQAALGSAAAAK